MAETFLFDELFERRLLAFMVRDVKFFLRNSGFIKEAYFRFDFHKDIFRLSKKYVEDYGKSISIVELRNEITKMYLTQKKKDVPIESYWDVLKEVFDEDLTTGDRYAEDVLLKFVQEKEMGSALMKAMERLTTRQDLNPILEDITKVLTIGNKTQLGYDYFKEVPVRTSKVYEGRESIPTGIKKLDKLLGGGLSAGELGVVVAPTSRGKTALMVNFAFSALKKRKNVIFVCLEGLDEDIGMRMDALICQEDKDGLKVKSEKICDHIMYVDRLLKKNMIIKMFPTESVNVTEIDQYINHEQMVRGFEADLIIIDYLALCKRNSKDESWMGTSYREGKGMAVRRKKPVWTAVQARNDALREKVVHATSIAESTNRIKSDSDVIVCICQTAEEEEQEQQPTTMRLYLDKNKNNPAKRQIPLIFDKSKGLIWEDETGGKPKDEPAK